MQLRTRAKLLFGWAAVMASLLFVADLPAVRAEDDDDLDDDDAPGAEGMVLTDANFR